MQSTAKTVDEYLESLPDDRRAAVSTVRNMVLKNLPKGYEEAMNWGAITYQVPLEIYPDTYNKQPLAYAALASQKNYMALYVMASYGSVDLRKQLEEGYKEAGKKLDMGKSCIRFKKLEDLAMEVVAPIIAAVPMDKYVAYAKSVRRK